MLAFRYQIKQISVLLSELFQLMFLCQYVPSGFKYSYIVSIPKPKDVRAKSHELWWL